MADVETTDIGPMATVQALARDSLLSYCVLMDPMYEPAPHSRAIVRALERLERREKRRLMLFVPPRHGKSYAVSERFPAWYMGRHPDHRIMLASYAAELAEANSRTVRELMEDERNPFEARLQPDSRSVGRWMTKQGGSLLAAGVGGGITGFGAHLLDIDDPFSGSEQADSATYRDRVWLWYQNTARTRLMPGGLQVICQTRWHEDDLAGRILNSKGGKDWEILNLPALAEENDPLGRALGEPLWPEWYPIDELPSVEKGEISSRGFQALYQQRPVPAGGGVFRAEWMTRRYTTQSLEHAKLAPRWTVWQSVDLGGKQGVGHDPSAIATWATDGISYYLLDYWSSQAEYADIKPVFARKYFQFRARQMLIEDATWAQPLISDLRRETGINVSAVAPVGSKWVRADAVSPLFESGKIVLPDNAPWLEAWIIQHLSFPNAPHDEAVDTTSQALSRMRVAPVQTQPFQMRRVEIR